MHAVYSLRRGSPVLTPSVKSREVSSSATTVHRLCLALLLLLLAASALALQDLLSVLVELELGDDNL
jgi:hypothetical protein